MRIIMIILDYCSMRMADAHLCLCVAGHIPHVVGVDEEGCFDTGGCQGVQRARRVGGIRRIIKRQRHRLQLQANGVGSHVEMVITWALALSYRIYLLFIKVWSFCCVELGSPASLSASRFEVMGRPYSDVSTFIGFTFYWVYDTALELGSTISDPVCR